MLRTVFDGAYDLWRRRWGRYAIEDPRPAAAGAPYTYFLPEPATLAAISPGDEVKLLFRGAPPSRKWDAERMWVEVTAVGPEGLTGTLSNTPSDMPQLKVGAVVAFQPWCVLDVIFADPARAPDETDGRREYWDRCLVDDCVLYEGVPVGYLYREAPEEQGRVEFPDSGWRIRGDLRGVAPEAIEARAASYVALGAVLNRDDSWLALIDQPIGAAFERDFERGMYVQESAA